MFFSRTISNILASIFVVFLSCTPFLSISQKNTQAGEKGSLPVYNYSAKEYKAATQNWSIVQDDRGVMYFGNNEGVLEYDGVSWRLIKVSNETNVRSLVKDANGRIYVGADGEIGFLEPNAAGSMNYHSLKDKIPSQDADFSDVWSAVATESGIYFQTDNKIFRWDGNTIKSWQAEKSFHRIFYVNDRIFVRQREVGLMELTNDKLVTLNGGNAFAEESIYGMVSLANSTSKEILICTKNKGLFTLTQENKNLVIKKFKTELDSYLTENISYHLLNSKSLYAIGTVTNGSAIVNLNGDFSSLMNKQAGLQDETIYSQQADGSGNLWLATSNGISRINIHSPVTIFSDKNGLNGHVLDIVRFHGSLYVATNYGISVLERGSFKDGINYQPADFKKIHSINEECWDLLPFSYKGYSTLLGVSSINIFSLDEKMNPKVILDCRPWRVYQSKYDSARVFIGLENGVTSLYRENNQWTKEETISEVKESIHSIAEDDDGNLWLGHNSGAIKISFSKGSTGSRKLLDKSTYLVTKYDTTNGLPARTIEIENVNGKMFFGTINGIYIQDNGKFVEESSLPNNFRVDNRQIHRLSHEKNSNKIWMETHLSDKYKFEFGYLKKESNDSYTWNLTPFLPYSEEIIHSIFHDEDGITWFGGSEGLYRYDAAADLQDNRHFNAIIRKVTAGRDSIIFNGTFFNEVSISSVLQNQSLKPELSFYLNSVIFEFSSLDFTNENAVKFQYYLEGFDKGWSNWKDETKAVYTNLPEGKHVFHVKSKNIFNSESLEATYEFNVLPPWYRTWWAYILYVLGSIGFVWGVVTYTSRGLKAIIKERTAEIVEQKEVIEYKNRNITDSINYAKKIQEAILPPRELMRSRFPESFILFRPKDIVAGDFYWFAEKEGKFIVAACDCTGHGVPGAFMSLISYSLLNEVLLEKNFANPAAALDTLKKGIIKSLGQTGQEGEQKDGMDMSLASFEVVEENGKKINKLSFAGANNPLYLLRKGELIELNADKMPIGIYLGIDRPFVNKEMELESGDTIYLFSDGYADQFGGLKGKKFTKKRYKELLLTIQHEPMIKQREILENTMDQWLGDQQLIDDVLVMGIRIS